MRLALFGGTFDPIHCGHLRVAAAAAGAFALDRVLFAPTGRQPLKAEPAVAPFSDRLAMVALALSHPCASDGQPPSPDPRFAVTSLDAPLPSGQPNYPVDLLAELARTTPRTGLFAITGADSFLTLRNWRSPSRLLDLAEWIVVSRPDLPLTPAFLDRPEFSFTPQQRSRIHLLPSVHEDISATQLRELLRTTPATTPSDLAASGLDQWLPPAVARYIHDHHLYE
jgi:nicotinate-nucleotide adenylyltransferase